MKKQHIGTRQLWGERRYVSLNRSAYRAVCAIAPRHGMTPNRFADWIVADALDRMGWPQ